MREPSECLQPALQRSPPTNRASATRKRRPAQRTSPNGFLAGSQLYSTVRPRQFIVVPLIPTSKKPACATCTHHLTRQPLLQKIPLPRCRLQPQPHPAKDSGDRGNSPAARPSDRPLLPLLPKLTFHGHRRKSPNRVSIGIKLWPVSPFVVVSCPAPPGTRQRAATALPRHRPGSHAVCTTSEPDF